MRYDFDKITDRRGSGSMKWDAAGDPEVIPMWVGDMDFPAPPAVTEALRQRVDHGVFGYAMVPPAYYESVTGWFQRRHQWKIDPAWIIYTSGVVPAVSCAIRALTLPGEKVLVQTPAYHCFFSSIRNCGCEILENPLRPAGDTYEIDFEDFDRKCADEKTTVFLLCNPHNPVGRVWTREELSRLLAICLRHGVTVISDEIHCELTMPGYSYVPFASLGEGAARHSVICCAPTKAFNIAGLQIANIVCADTLLRRKVNRAVNIHEVCDVNVFSYLALQAAYDHGEEWLDQLRQYLWDNYQALRQYFQAELSAVKVTKLEATYFVWLDISAFGVSSAQAFQDLLHLGKVYVNEGTEFGTATGEGFIRVNIGCPRATMTEGLRRIVATLRRYVG